MQRPSSGRGPVLPHPMNITSPIGNSDQPVSQHFRTDVVMKTTGREINRREFSASGPVEGGGAPRQSLLLCNIVFR